MDGNGCSTCYGEAVGDVAFRSELTGIGLDGKTHDLGICSCIAFAELPIR